MTILIRSLLPLLLILPLAAASRDEASSAAGSLTITDPSGGQPHTYAIESFNLSVAPPPTSPDRGTTDRTANISFSTPGTADTFLLQWVAGKDAKRLVTVKISSTARKSELQYEMQVVQASAFNASFSNGMEAGNLNLTLEHLKMNGVPIF